MSPVTRPLRFQRSVLTLNLLRLRYLEADGVPGIIADLFAEQDGLYDMGARNFLFIDVPPIHRSPVGTFITFKYSDQILLTTIIGLQFSRVDPTFYRVYEVWNGCLREHVAKFSANHPDTTTFLFSSWNTFTRVLDDPVGHGFGPEHVGRCGGDIWTDNLHPSTKMHDWIAHDISKFLETQPSYESKAGLPDDEIESCDGQNIH